MHMTDEQTGSQKGAIHNVASRGRGPHNKEIMRASSQISQSSVRAVRIERFTARVFGRLSYRVLGYSTDAECSYTVVKNERKSSSPFTIAVEQSFEVSQIMRHFFL